MAHDRPGAVARRIVAYVVDDAGDWLVRLDCGHVRHVRHRPPLVNNAWVLDEEERRRRIGQLIECGRCARLELPAGLHFHRRTEEFTETTLPAGLRSAHRLRPGSWGVIHVLEGRLEYQLSPPIAMRIELEAGSRAAISPAIDHAVAPLGHVRFFIEFLRVADDPR